MPRKKPEPVESREARLTKAAGHKLRIRILRRVRQGEASPNEMAKEFKASLPLISYHVRILRELGCLELVRTTPRRGAIEHHYKLTPDGKEVTMTWGGASAADKCRRAYELLQEAQREMLEMGMKGFVSSNGVNPITENKEGSLCAVRAQVATEEYVAAQGAAA